MDDKKILQIFKDAGVLMEGHFLLTSGLHSPVYWEKFKVLQYPEYTSQLCGLIAEHYKQEHIKVVAGPTLGGVILAFETARQLKVRCAFAEKDGTKRVFRRGLFIERGQRVLVVDDILTTGGSVIEVINAVRASSGNIVGIGILVDRSDQTIDLGFPLFSCLKSVTQTYSPADCPLCSKGVPLIRLGG
ncbi:MAG: orotate phosphoribosyltransferase [Dehalococcoidia bacterium]|jgi:orotate phosphoribosyltransferase